MAITAYIKPTNFCSIGCEHCYLSLKTRESKQVMSNDGLVKAATLIKNLSGRQGDADINIVWHGGEPMMLPPSWYYSAIEVIDSVLGEGNYRQSMQTSLLPYSKDWKKIVTSKFDSFLGSSIDFTQRKVKASSDAYLASWMKKVNQARSDGIYIIPGMVPTRMQVGKGSEIVKWFMDNEFGHFNIERYSHYGEKKIDIPSNMEHSRFLIEVFDEVLRQLLCGKTPPSINVVVAAIRGILYSVPGDRWGTTCQKDFIIIEPNGDLNSCPDRTSHEAPFSNIADGVDGFVGSEKRRSWIRVQNISHKKDHCVSCEYRLWCKSACPITKNGPSEGESECSGYKTYLNHIEKIMTIDKNKTILIDYIGG